MLHREKMLAEIIEKLEKAGERELRIVLAFVRTLTNEK